MFDHDIYRRGSLEAIAESQLKFSEVLTALDFCFFSSMEKKGLPDLREPVWQRQIISNLERKRIGKLPSLDFEQNQ